MALFSSASAESWIIPVVKAVDALFLPLALIPLYLIVRALGRPADRELFREGAVAVFAVASPWPMMFIGDLQKNAFAIPLFFLFLWLALRYLQQPSVRRMISAGACLVLIGLSHFGVFAVATLTLGLGWLLYAGRRAVMPLAVLAGLSAGLVALFDPTRAWRLLTVTGELFHRPMLLDIDKA